MTPEERADFWEALAEYRLNPTPVPSVWIQGFGFMLENGYDATSSKAVVARRQMRFEPAGRTFAQGHDGCERRHNAQ
jgi:hypothetical protein